MAVFCPKRKLKLTDEEKKPRKERIKRKQYMEAKPQKSKVWLSPPREKGGVTAKNLYGCGGRCEGRGERDEGWDEISMPAGIVSGKFRRFS
jgi:hypothetical protein